MSSKYCRKLQKITGKYMAYKLIWRIAKQGEESTTRKLKINLCKVVSLWRIMELKMMN